MTAIAILHRDEIIAGLTAGKRISDLGMQCSPQAISKALRNDPAYREAIEHGFHVRLDRAENGIDAASEGVDVARARAKFEAVRWRAEREFPDTWGNRTQITALVATVSLDSLLSGNARGVLDAVISEQVSTPENEAA